MSAALFTGFLFWCLQTSAAGAELPAPSDVTMVTLNTNYTLTWDWDQSAADGHAVNFTVQYVAMYKLKLKKPPAWKVVCEETLHRSCDLTECDLHYLGIYMIRVRANLNGHHSNWVDKEFCPDKDAAVGPPSRVNLSPAGSALDVFISDPVTSNNSSMREKLNKLYYHIVYWEGLMDQQASEVQRLSSATNLVTLPGMKAWTWYCVRVQSRSDFYNKSSGFTATQCMQTEGAIPWWLIFLSFLGSLLICFTIVLLTIFCFYKVCKTVKLTLYPSNQMPPHLKEYLCSSPGSDQPHFLTLNSESELLCDKVSICPEPVLEIHHAPPNILVAPPSGLEPDSSGRHSRQDSGGSADSGVYSTGGSSSLQQPGADQSSDPERVKMQDVFTGLKRQALVADEGIMDMCV